MSTASYFLIFGASVMILSGLIMPRLDKVLANRSGPDSRRRSVEWQRFQRTKSRQGLMLGAFLFLIGVFSVLTG